MNQSKADKVLDYILKNTAKLSPEKIEALAKVVEAVKDINETVEEPNTLPILEEHETLMEDRPMDFTQIQGIEMDGIKKEINIIKA